MEATKLQEVKVLSYSNDGKSAAIGLKNEAGAEFGSLVSSKEAVELLSEALSLTGRLPPHIPDPANGDRAAFVEFEADSVEVQEGAAPDKLCLVISAGGARLAAHIGIDQFLSGWSVNNET